MTTNDDHIDKNRNGDSSKDLPKDPRDTFKYRVSLEWGPAVECHEMNQIADISDFVVDKLAEIHFEDAQERPEPDIARITIDRIDAGPTKEGPAVSPQ